jgi:hypothetical protein
MDDPEVERGVEKVVAEKRSALAVEAHPTRPLFLAGGGDGSVGLWEFGQSRSLATYRVDKEAAVAAMWGGRGLFVVKSLLALLSSKSQPPPPSNPQSALPPKSSPPAPPPSRFHSQGLRFAVAALDGSVSVFALAATAESSHAYAVLPAHIARCSDVLFLESGSKVRPPPPCARNRSDSDGWKKPCDGPKRRRLGPPHASGTCARRFASNSRRGGVHRGAAGGAPASLNGRKARRY